MIFYFALSQLVRIRSVTLLVCQNWDVGVLAVIAVLLVGISSWTVPVWTRVCPVTSELSMMLSSAGSPCHVCFVSVYFKWQIKSVRNAIQTAWMDAMGR